MNLRRPRIWFEDEPDHDSLRLKPFEGRLGSKENAFGYFLSRLELSSLQPEKEAFSQLCLLFDDLVDAEDKVSRQIDFDESEDIKMDEKSEKYRKYEENRCIWEGFGSNTSETSECCLLSVCSPMTHCLCGLIYDICINSKERKDFRGGFDVNQLKQALIARNMCNNDIAATNVIKMLDRSQHLLAPTSIDTNKVWFLDPPFGDNLKSKFNESECYKKWKSDELLMQEYKNTVENLTDLDRLDNLYSVIIFVMVQTQKVKLPFKDLLLILHDCLIFLQQNGMVLNERDVIKYVFKGFYGYDWFCSNIVFTTGAHYVYEGFALTDAFGSTQTVHRAILRMSSYKVCQRFDLCFCFCFVMRWFFFVCFLLWSSPYLVINATSTTASTDAPTFATPPICTILIPFCPIDIWADFAMTIAIKPSMLGSISRIFARIGVFGVFLVNDCHDLGK